nr:unnamed protein product [Spirometra erinaceieuropaei]
MSFTKSKIPDAWSTDLAIETIELLLQSKYNETKNRLGHAQVLQLLKSCLRTYFTFDGTIYEQVKGTPMGSPISRFIAEAVPQRLESLVFQHHKPKFWARYVDHTFVVIDRDQLLTFKERLNAVFPDIQFTMEEEENNQLAFLDVLVCRRDCGGLKIKVFRKAANTMQVLNFNSNDPISHKRSCDLAIETIELLLQSKYNETKNRLGHAQVLQLLKSCLRTYFTFDGTIYEQVKGTPMGSPISRFIAEAVPQRLESLVFQHHKPKFWARCVDHTFVVIDRDQLLTFKERLNAVYPDIQFTMEEEENNQLAFLDVLVCRRDCSGLNIKVFRKAANTMQVLNFNSNDQISHKRSCVRTLYRRVETHCSEPEDKIAELQYLRRVFKANGYPRNFVNRCIRKMDERPNRTDTKVWRAFPNVKNVSEAVGRLLAPLGVGVAQKLEATIRRQLMKPKNNCHGKKRLESFIEFSAIADKATTSEKPEDNSKREWPNTLQRCGEMTPVLKLRLIRRVPATHSNLRRPKFSQEVTTV